MGQALISKHQGQFLDYFNSSAKLNSSFYLTGGTALTKYYLQHRYSEDLDFFCESDFTPQDITPYIYKAKSKLGFVSFDFQQSFNRNIYQLLFSNNDFLKVEFTYYPFTQIETVKLDGNIKVDSLLDITVNKVFTISQNPRGRDYFDLYVILNQTNWDITKLLAQARIKFDWHIDKLQFGSQLLKVTQLMDDPLVQNNSKYDLDSIRKYFKNISKKIGSEILKK